MSEIKGQLLGIVMAIALFGIVIAIMVSSFGKASTTIGSRIEQAANQTETYPPAAQPAAAAPAGN